MEVYKVIERYTTVGVVLGIFGMFLWAFTMSSIIVNIGCIHCSVIGLDSRNKDISFAALILGIIGLILTLFRGIVLF